MEFITVENVSKAYSNHQALSEVSLEIPKGSVYGLLGPNGAGKTTLIRIMNRITMPDSGTVYFDGKPIDDKDIYRIGYLPEERGLYKKMKVGEQAIFLAQMKGLSRAEALERLKKWFKKFEITWWWDKKVEELSKGMAQKVQFIVTVIHQPELLIFDEPFSGFDPINANLLKDEILALKNQGSTVIFSTHNMSSVEEVCDHITLINNSKNILSGNVNEIRRRHMKGKYSLDFTGDRALLQEQLAQMCLVNDPSQAQNPYFASVDLETDGEISTRELIAKINDCVQIHRFSEQIPSMNDIFIKAVNHQL